MAIKGYTDSEKAQKNQEKLARITMLVGTTHLLLMGVNIVLAVLGLGVIAFITVVVYIVLYGIYVRGADMLAGEGYAKAKYFTVFKYISIVGYALTFLAAILGGMGG